MNRSENRKTGAHDLISHWPHHMALLFLLIVHLQSDRQRQFSRRRLLTVLPKKLLQAVLIHARVTQIVT